MIVRYFINGFQGQVKPDVCTGVQWADSPGQAGEHVMPQSISSCFAYKSAKQVRRPLLGALKQRISEELVPGSRLAVKSRYKSLG